MPYSFCCSFVHISSFPAISSPTPIEGGLFAQLTLKDLLVWSDNKQNVNMPFAWLAPADLSAQIDNDQVVNKDTKSISKNQDSVGGSDNVGNELLICHI